LAIGRSVAAIACLVLTLNGCQRIEPPPRANPSAAAAVPETPVVLFLGTSLTAGYGLPSDEAFPALVQERIDRAGLDYRVVNAGVSGDTSAGGLARIDWLLRAPVAVLVLELGANDMLRGQDLAELERNLQEIIDRTRSAYPAVRLVVAGMRAPPNLGASYVRGFEAVYPALAQKNDGTLLPFILEGVAGDAAFNQPDGIHPTPEGHQIVAENLWEVLEPVLR
jgi:acyl-CoA thioesterase-1